MLDLTIEFLMFQLIVILIGYIGYLFHSHRHSGFKRPDIKNRKGYNFDKERV